MLRHYIIAMEAAMHRRSWDAILYDLAEGQAGYFTAAQARRAGVHQVRLVQLQKRGDLERATRGVYRLARFPSSALGQYMEAALWPQVRRPDAQGVISHESALAIYGLSGVSPAKVHVTLPTAFRIRRAVPKHLVLHYADLEPGDTQRVEGIPVTTPSRAIRDAHASHLGPALVRQAIEDGRRTGQLALDEADRLERQLLGTKSRPRKAASPRRRGSRV
jgi:predicted transcriptional regulator of viral defense system